MDVVPIDASALVELVVAGRHRVGAEALLARYEAVAPRLVLIAAAHALVEATSALRRLVRVGILDPTPGSHAVHALGNIAIWPSTPLVPACHLDGLASSG